MGWTNFSVFMLIVVLIFFGAAALYFAGYYLLYIKSQKLAVRRTSRNVHQVHSSRDPERGFAVTHSFVTVYSSGKEDSSSGDPKPPPPPPPSQAIATQLTQVSEVPKTIVQDSDTCSADRQDVVVVTENMPGSCCSSAATKPSSEAPDDMPSIPEEIVTIEPLNKADLPKSFTAETNIETGSVKKIPDVKPKSPLTAEKVGCNLVICTTATTSTFAGFLLDLKNKTCEYYSYNVRFLPWAISRPNVVEREDLSATGAAGDAPKLRKDLALIATEVNAKNVLFALILWGQKIKDQRYKLYVTNDACVSFANEYGARVRRLLKHMEKCEGAYKVNSFMVLKPSDKTMENYEQWAKPAMDLCKNSFLTFVDKISTDFQLERFDGTHEYFQEEVEESTSRVRTIYATTDYYETYLRMVARKIPDLEKLTCLCGYSFERTPSFRGVMLPYSSHNDINLRQHYEASETFEKGKPPGGHGGSNSKFKFATWKWMTRGSSKSSESYSRISSGAQTPSVMRGSPTNSLSYSTAGSANSNSVL